MIRRIVGTVEETGLTYVVVDVKGVGYQVYTSVAGSHFTQGAQVTFYTYLSVQERALDLYGFGTLDELEMFELLLTLNKVGPKSALQIMSQADLVTLKKAIATEDASYLTKMSGIGKKTAENIVAGLKDKIENLSGMSAEDVGATGGAGSKNASDIIDALIALGYPQKDARDAVQKLSQENPEALEDTNLAITTALKQLGG